MNNRLGSRERGGPMIEFTLARTTTAPIETVFDTLTDHRAIANYVWAVRRSTLDREGTPAPNGVGAVRRLEAVGPAIVEEIIEYQRPKGYAYKLVSGAPSGITSARSSCAKPAQVPRSVGTYVDTQDPRS